MIRLARELLKHSEHTSELQEGHASDVFLGALERISSHKKIVLVFDEIEYISPESPLNSHWNEDFVPFWQTIWHAQSLFRNIAVFVGGVNPTVVEQDLVGNTQNPLFGIVPHRYLSGLSVDEVRRMLRTLGRPMGLRFEEDAVEYLAHRYGGHPLLTRIASSIIHKMLRDSSEQLPKNIDSGWLAETEVSRESELSFYCGHVVSELKLFYPDEYELLKEISNGNLADVYEFTTDPVFASHLNSYGLLGRSATGRPSISIPVLEKFVQLQDARERGTQTISVLQPVEERERWLARRISAINDNFEELQRAIERLSGPNLFGVHSYPESHKFFDLGVVTDENSFANFINTCNRCFVESIEKYGMSIGRRDYFWQEVKLSYPELHEALRRIKVYRHWRVHIKLNDVAIEELTFFRDQDLSGRSPTTVKELWYQLQQCVLDALLVGIFVETDRLT